MLKQLKKLDLTSVLLLVLLAAVIVTVVSANCKCESFSEYSRGKPGLKMASFDDRTRQRFHDRKAAGEFENTVFNGVL